MRVHLIKPSSFKLVFKRFILIGQNFARIYNFGEVKFKISAHQNLISVKVKFWPMTVYLTKPSKLKIGVAWCTLIGQNFTSWIHITIVIEFTTIISKKKKWRDEILNFTWPKLNFGNSEFWFLAGQNWTTYDSNGQVNFSEFGLPKLWISLRQNSAF